MSRPALAGGLRRSREGARFFRKVLCRAAMACVAATPVAALQDPPGAEAARACEAAAQVSDWEAAVTHCETAILALPDSFGIHYFLGFAHQARESWAEAAAAFDSFLAAAEPSPGAATRLGDQIALAVRSGGIAWFRAGRPERALPLLQRAAEADPADAEVLFWLGVGLFGQGDAQAAEAAFSAVVRKAPQISQALFFLGQLRYDAGDHEEARARLDAYLAAAPEGSFRADAHWMAGSMALRSADSAEAEERAVNGAAVHHFSALLEAEPDGPRAAVAHYFLGTIAADREDCDAARRHYGRFLAIAPDHERAPEVHRYLAGDLGRCGVRG